MLVLIFAFAFASCREEEPERIWSEVGDMPAKEKKEECLQKFAKVLSQVVHEDEEVRMFLKDEALKMFDRNYDVLYYLVKDEDVSGQTFRDRLISYSSKEEMEEIEKTLPLLNIYTSKISLFNILPENLNIKDSEIPVAVSRSDSTILFFDGKKELALSKGEIPNFHVFVVNENNRVKIPQESDMYSKSSKSVVFRSPNYDGSSIFSVKSFNVKMDNIGNKAIEAYRHFNKNDGSLRQKSYQRDYIYYGITPENQKGTFNRSISEYLNVITVNPAAYFRISDQGKEDPINNASSTEQKKRGLSQQELLDRLWTRGSYNFRFEISSSEVDHPQIVCIPLMPEDLWNFNIAHSYRHSTWFRHSKNTYTINPRNFTARDVYLRDLVDMGKWDISEEALYRYVKIYEEDATEEVEETTTYEMSVARKENFSGNAKIGIGLKKVNVDVGGSASSENSTTTKITKTVTTKRTLGSDLLGSVRIYFYDPIVESVYSTVYRQRSYNTGSIKFGVTAR
ncbi:MAG: hypothetical protein ACK5L5_06230 [Bacteroidales bacterium]